MYRRAIITDEISQDLQLAADLAAEYGLQGVELRSVWEKPPHELSAEDISRIQSICSKKNLAVCALSSPCFKCGIDNEEEYAAHLRIFERTAQVAREFGVTEIRGFTFWKIGEFEDYLPLIVRRYEAAVRLMGQYGMTLVIEQDPSVFATNAGLVRRVIEAVGSDSVRALWDGGNDLWDPACERPFPEGYGIIRPYISHVHIKDAVRTPEGTVGCCVGEGQARIFDQLDALKADGYGGWVVAEPHYRISGGIDEKLLRTPGGAQFSADGYEPSRRFLEKWAEYENDAKTV